MPKTLKLPETTDGKRIVACTITNLYGGDMLVTPAAAAELVAHGIIVATRTLGHFVLVDEMDTALWAYMRKR